VTTTTARVAVDGRGPYPGARPGTALPTRHRRPGYIGLAVVLIVGLAAVGAYWYSQAGQKTPVVVVIRDVPAGHVIGRSDVSTVDVAGAVTAIGGSRIDSVVGQVATVELLPNMLLQRSMLTSSSPLPASDAMVGVEVKPGQLPANGLADGATVQVLQLPSKETVTAAGSSAALTAIVLAARVTVYGSASDPSQTGGMLVTLIVPRHASSAVAAASGAGLVALVQVGQ
jgi:SAF domain